ncbi:MAG: hypothetical protein M1830_003509 [Pleopsidium flavum]|nr:MAG: hypothetical protein M1830_003509 [Pleopsidium flavum]
MATSVNLNANTSIPRLTDHNFAEWLVDIRAHLRRSKLWKYTQEDVSEETKNKDKWEEAADLMTPTLSAEVKRKLTEDEFNNGYRMLVKLTHLLQPGGDAQFMRLTREYYTLRYDGETESLSEFLTRVKVLEERIDLTNVQMDNDKRTLLCLSMSLPAKYRSLVQIWSAMDGMTAEKATEMLLEEERRSKDEMEELGTTFGALMARGGKKRVKQCSHCKKDGHLEDRCWIKHPEQRPVAQRATEEVFSF